MLALDAGTLITHGEPMRLRLVLLLDPTLDQ
jgi:hypothetical protein